MATAGYSAQFLLAPKTSHDMYFTEKVPYSSSQAAFMGHALGGAAALMASCAENPTKGNLRAVGGMFLTGPLLSTLRQRRSTHRLPVLPPFEADSVASAGRHSPGAAQCSARRTMAT